MNLAAATAPLMFVVIGAVTFCCWCGIVGLVRRGLLASRRVDESVTWGCGYPQPTARMQYTASSFAQPLTDLFRPLLGTRKKVVGAARAFSAPKPH